MFICFLYFLSVYLLFACFHIGVLMGKEMHCQTMTGGAPQQPHKHPHPITHLGVSFTENLTCDGMPVFIVMICRSTLGILVPGKCCKHNGFQIPKKEQVKTSFFSHLIWFQPFPLDGRSWIWDPTIITLFLGLGPDSWGRRVQRCWWQDASGLQTPSVHSASPEKHLISSGSYLSIKAESSFVPIQGDFACYFSAIIWCTGVIWLFCSCWTRAKSVRTCQACPLRLIMKMFSL